jgi:hypothetical protein
MRGIIDLKQHVPHAGIGMIVIGAIGLKFGQPMRLGESQQIFQSISAPSLMRILNRT